MKVSHVRGFATLLFGAVALMAAGGVRAQQTQDTVSDAQVESNVLKALASAPELSTQNIQTTAVYGTVTMTGNVATEAMRSEAENLIARTQGVKKVVDELTLGTAPAQTAENGDQANMPPQDAQGQNLQLQPDGSYAPPPPDSGDQAAGVPEQAQQAGTADQYGPAGPPPGYGNQAGQPQQPGAADQYGPAGPPPGYGNQPGPQGYNGQPSAQDYGPAGPPPGRQPMYANGAAPGYPVQGGQQAGIPVTVPPGALLRIRINRGLDSQHIKPGTPFDGTVLSDVAADGVIAIPRGATVTGVVVDARKTKALSGKGELALAVNSVTLGGQVYPLQTDVWQRVGQDKSGSTVNHAIGLGILGAFVGAVAGGGPGAAIGAGVGAGAGVASSAGGPRGQIIVPPEAVLVFHTAQPETLRTVSEQEMQRLSYAAGPPPPPQPYYGRPYPY